MRVNVKSLLVIIKILHRCAYHGMTMPIDVQNEAVYLISWTQNRVPLKYTPIRTKENDSFIPSQYLYKLRVSGHYRSLVIPLAYQCASNCT